MLPCRVFVSPVIGSQPSLQAPETQGGPGPSPWQSLGLRTEWKQMCLGPHLAWCREEAEQEEPEGASGLGGCLVFRAKRG